jgi:hypothetical protein
MLLGECSNCRIVAVDRDPDALEAAKAGLAPLGTRVRVIQARFDEALRSAGLSEPLAGVLLDLGVSSQKRPWLGSSTNTGRSLGPEGLLGPSSSVGPRRPSGRVTTWLLSSTGRWAGPRGPRKKRGSSKH